jgi:hypothetical protein
VFGDWTSGSLEGGGERRLIVRSVGVLENGFVARLENGRVIFAMNFERRKRVNGAMDATSDLWMRDGLTFALFDGRILGMTSEIEDVRCERCLADCFEVCWSGVVSAWTCAGCHLDAMDGAKFAGSRVWRAVEPGD